MYQLQRSSGRERACACSGRNRLQRSFQPRGSCARGPAMFAVVRRVVDIDHRGLCGTAAGRGQGAAARHARGGCSPRSYPATTRYPRLIPTWRRAGAAGRLWAGGGAVGTGGLGPDQRAPPGCRRMAPRWAAGAGAAAARRAVDAAATGDTVDRRLLRQGMAQKQARAHCVRLAKRKNCRKMPGGGQTSIQWRAGHVAEISVPSDRRRPGGIARQPCTRAPSRTRCAARAIRV